MLQNLNPKEHFVFLSEKTEIFLLLNCPSIIVPSAFPRKRFPAASWGSQLDLHYSALAEYVTKKQKKQTNMKPATLLLPTESSATNDQPSMFCCSNANPSPKTKGYFLHSDEISDSFFFFFSEILFPLLLLPSHLFSTSTVLCNHSPNVPIHSSLPRHQHIVTLFLKNSQRLCHFQIVGGSSIIAVHKQLCNLALHRVMKQGVSPVFHSSSKRLWGSKCERSDKERHALLDRCVWHLRPFHAASFVALPAIEMRTFPQICVLVALARNARTIWSQSYQTASLVQSQAKLAARTSSSHCAECRAVSCSGFVDTDTCCESPPCEQDHPLDSSSFEEVLNLSLSLLFENQLLLLSLLLMMMLMFDSKMFQDKNKPDLSLRVDKIFQTPESGSWSA